MHIVEGSVRKHASDLYLQAVKRQKVDFNGILLDLTSDSEILLISCSGVVPNKVIYAMENTSREISTSKLFICDHRSLWYYKGIEGHTTSFDDTIELVGVLVDLIKPRLTYAIGTSGGGYMVLALAAKLGLDGALAFSPQSSIGAIWRKLHGDHRWEQQMSSIRNHIAPAVPYDIQDLIRGQKRRNSAKRSEFHVIYPSNDALDAVHAVRLQTLPGVTVYRYECVDHNVSSDLSKRGKLTPILEAFMQRSGGDRISELDIILGIRRSIFRLVSHHGRTLFYDTETNRIRQRPIDDVTTNLVLEETNGAASLVFFDPLLDVSDRIVGFTPEGIALLGQPGSASDLRFERLDDGKVALRQGANYLSCDVQGETQFDRLWCREWERIALEAADPTGPAAAADVNRPLSAVAQKRPPKRTPSASSELVDNAPQRGERRYITVAGPFNSSWSLAAVNRRLALEIETAHPGSCCVYANDYPLLDVPPDEISKLIELNMRPQRIGGPQIVIHQRWPVTAPAAPPAPQGDVALAYFFWEESHVPQTLANTLNQFDGVLVPADFIRSALIDSGVTKPIIDVGFSPNLEPFSALYGKPSNGQRKARPFTFLHVSSCFPRKGVDVLLTAYARAFRNTDNVRLIIKKPKAAKRPDVESIKVLNPDMAELILMEEDIDVGAMRNLYLEADAVVSPSRGEGFNLPAAEAIAAGMHLIVTGYGGHMQFCRPEVARLLRYTMAPSMQPNSLWAEPDVDDLCAALREAKEGKTDRDPKARDDILALLGGKAWIARIMDAIDKVAGTAS